MFSCEYCETLKNIILKNICERLLLILWTRIEITQGKNLNQWKSMGFQFRKLTRLQRKSQKNCIQIWTNTKWKTVPPCRDEIQFPYVIVGWDLSRLDGVKSHLRKPGSCNHHLNKCQVENCAALPGRNLISTCNRRVRSVAAWRGEISSWQTGIM